MALIGGIVRCSRPSVFGRWCRRSNGAHLSQTRHLTTNNAFFKVSEEIREAINSKKPVVALETTIYTHGFPYPENVALASHLESVVRVNGGVPATIGVLDGVARVGLNPEELIRLTSSAGNPDTLKVSRRDLAYATGLHLTQRTLNGGTTIAGTMVLAHLAGISVFATGGLGGVHRGGHVSMDVSADLTELGRTPVAVVVGGCKGFLDIGRTLEFLETQGVAVGTFADGRAENEKGKVPFPGFWCRDSGLTSPFAIRDEREAAAMVYAQNEMGLSSGILFANPIPEQHEIPRAEMEVIIEEALVLADRAGAAAMGKDNTPFVLDAIKQLSKGTSVKANRELVSANVARGTLVAREVAALQREGGWEAKTESGDDVFGRPRDQSQVGGTDRSRNGLCKADFPVSLPDSVLSPKPAPTSSHPLPSVLVAGALALDYTCTFTPFTSLPSAPTISPSPQLRTSNPSIIRQTLGGVARNVARACHLLGTPTRLVSAVADDLAGLVAKAELARQGMDGDGITFVSGGRNNGAGLGTAQYVAVNDAKGELVVGMADMRILEDESGGIGTQESSCSAIVRMVATALQPNSATAVPTPPTHLILDANLPSKTLHTLLRLAKSSFEPLTTVLEPVSAPKSTRLFPSSSSLQLPLFPDHVLDLLTPNTSELSALHSAARSTGAFDRPEWWRVIDALGIPSSGARHEFERALAHDVSAALLTSDVEGRMESLRIASELVDRGVPQMAVQLLPFAPVVLVKDGRQGVVLAMLLRREDERLSDAGQAGWVVARAAATSVVGLGGVYLRRFTVPEKVLEEDVVSVNGVGDTFLGAVVSGLAKGKKVEDTVGVAQKAAVVTLRSEEAVGIGLAELRGEV
ncbi:Indigoidine synthase A like protein-domain-containing protein [Lineolata rhizophorae]|uniref:Indigoidine synthase A like protein-domain-containing protein n=1 Tax=Lineolata rhizophorae TaxID=578093 RepID=A0A6A6NUU6_9PEZI|nr:Indigoidine synthase A like protein-domain-containing protein [Lineolata rhizophorae]